MVLPVFEALDVVLGDTSVKTESPSPKEGCESTSLAHLNGVLEEMPWPCQGG